MIVSYIETNQNQYNHNFLIYNQTIQILTTFPGLITETRCIEAFKLWNKYISDLRPLLSLFKLS